MCGETITDQGIEGNDVFFEQLSPTTVFEPGRDFAT